MEVSMVISFQPIYYMAWIIQPTINGYLVYKRNDNRYPSDIIFASLDDAKDYIDGEQITKMGVN